MTTLSLVWLLFNLYTTPLSMTLLASDCNPARKDPPSPKDPSPPKDAKPPGGYNPKV